MLLKEADTKAKLVDPQYSGRRVEVAWEYFEPYLKTKSKLYQFLSSIPEENLEKLLHSIHFYWAHDVFRLCEGMPKERPLDIYVYLSTLSIVEFLMSSHNKSGSWGKISGFFDKYLLPSEKKKINSEIQAHNDKTKEAVRVLYDIRNEFVHNAQWFYFHGDVGFATIDKVNKHSGNSYAAVIKLGRDEYLELFWKAFLRFFNFKV